MVNTAVIILNWNGENFLREFLPSVIKYTPQELARVIVADNGSTDGSLELLHQEFPTVEVLQFDKNYGFTGGYNRAIAAIEDVEYILLLNSDVVVTEHYLEPLIARLDSNATIGAAQPKIKAYKNRDSFEYAGAAGGFIDYLGFPYCRGRLLSNLERDYGQYDQECDIFWASGAAMFIRRNLYLSLGGFDEDYFAHMEEIDLCWRIHNDGYKVVAAPQSTIYHLGGGTLPYGSPRKLFLNHRNSLYTLFKNLHKNRLIFTLFLRMCVDGLIAIIYLLTNKKGGFKAVIDAHISFYKSISILKKKRAAQPNKKRTISSIYKGSILVPILPKMVRKT